MKNQQTEIKLTLLLDAMVSRQGHIGHCKCKLSTYEDNP